MSDDAIQTGPAPKFLRKENFFVESAPPPEEKWAPQRHDPDGFPRLLKKKLYLPTNKVWQCVGDLAIRWPKSTASLANMLCAGRFSLSTRTYNIESKAESFFSRHFGERWHLFSHNGTTCVKVYSWNSMIAIRRVCGEVWKAKIATNSLFAIVQCLVQV